MSIFPDILLAALAVAAPLSRVDRALADYDAEAGAIKASCPALKEEPRDWRAGAAKLDCMMRLDQLMRRRTYPVPAKLSKDEVQEFYIRFGSRVHEVDDGNLAALKRMLASLGWPTISAAGKDASHAAWLIAQHADRDVPFQKRVLDMLAELYPNGECLSVDYAYLYDRVAMNENRPQRFGTQGRCTGHGAWTPHDMEDPGRVDERRASMGLQSLAEYRAGFKDICP